MHLPARCCQSCRSQQGCQSLSAACWLALRRSGASRSSGTAETTMTAISFSDHRWRLVAAPSWRGAQAAGGQQPVLRWPRLQTGAAAQARQPPLQMRAQAAGPRAAALLRPPAAHARVGSPAPHATPVDKVNADHAAATHPSLIDRRSTLQGGSSASGVNAQAPAANNAKRFSHEAM